MKSRDWGSLDYENLTRTQLKVLEDSFLDALLFAGGLSVQYSANVALKVLTASRLSDLKEQLYDEEKLTHFIYEIVRRFPPVKGFNLWNRLTNTHIILNLQGAGYDKENFESPEFIDIFRENV